MMGMQATNRRLIDLFAGVAGFSIAGHKVGWQTVLFVEKEPWLQRLLKKRFPGIPIIDDIHKITGDEIKEPIFAVSAGFPCQPASTAGKRRGRDDDRFLWSETFRVIKIFRPAWVVLENVPGLLSLLEPGSLSEVETKALQLFNQGGEETAVVRSVHRRIIATIIEELKTAGYHTPEYSDGTPIIFCVPACSVSAPHRRDRIWIIAHSNTNADRGRFSGIQEQDEESRAQKWKQQQFGGSDTVPAADAEGQQHDRKKHSRSRRARHSDNNRIAADTSGQGLQREINLSEPGRYFISAQPYSNLSSQGLQGGEQSGTLGLRESPGSIAKFHKSSFSGGWAEHWLQAVLRLCRVDDGISGRMDRHRGRRIKALGNSIVWQIALEFFKAIEAAEISAESEK
jgi:DNA (cytosine-5)-methyltransferase 1